MSSLHPLQTTRHLRDTYLRYLKTAYPFQDEGLRASFWKALQEPDKLIKGPLLEAAPPFEPGRSISQLVTDGILEAGFKSLCSSALPWERPLYYHQDQAITRLSQHERNLIVASGTGSGKTETFLIPLLNHLLKEQRCGTLNQPGVRALLLYPMNALANDQLKRLRRVLADFPAITFGRYTGETEETEEQAKNRFYDQFPGEPVLNNELMSRRQMRDKPPHLLLTNYAMLEYLLLRPEDCAFFDDEKGRHWRFIVLDEAHTYDGASGIEVAMLLRRLKDRVVESQPDKIRCIATSATLGRGRADFPAAVKFASSLFGETFEWFEHDTLRQDVIEAKRVSVAALGAIWGKGSPELYQALQDALLLESSTLETVLAPLVKTIATFVPISVLDYARLKAEESYKATNSLSQALEVFLYDILRGDQSLHQLHERLTQRPYLIETIAGQIFPDKLDAANELVKLVNLTVQARPDPDSLPLLPARYHVFARALEGAFACLNAKGHCDGQPRVFLNRYEKCPECAGLVVELATCVRCGATYVVGQEEVDALAPSNSSNNQPKRFVLQQLTTETESVQGRRAYFLLGAEVSQQDEDEDTVVEQDSVEDNQTSEVALLCLRCGVVAYGPNPNCRCGPAIPPLPQPLRRVELNNKAEPGRCLQCSSRSNSGIIYRFLTGQDAPVSVLATALYQELPPSSQARAANLPGEGRKLLVFSDSRQDAAFFAPYLERTYNQILHRCLILKSLLADQEGRNGELRLVDVAGRLQKEASKAGMFRQSQSNPQRKDIVTTWLMQELMSLERRISLEGLGLLQFRLVRPDRWQVPAALKNAPWNLSNEQAWNLQLLLLDTLRHQGIISFPENISPGDEAFAPRNRELSIREQHSDSRAGILAWLPGKGSNRRLDLLIKLLGKSAPQLSQPEKCQQALETLSGLWRDFTGPNSTWKEHLVSHNKKQAGIVHQLSYQFWELLPSEQGQGYRCNKCQIISSVNLCNLCPTNGCGGQLETLNSQEATLSENHYHALYLGLKPVPLAAEEHTAQWTSNEAGKVQGRFIDGEVNILSCSTTFELGVDVGELQAVLMRNVPPTTANYVQRAGRAGRRTDSAAFALTYAQRRSHDLTHYAEPERIVAGKVSPPRIVLSNQKIVLRHMKAVLLAAFFRKLKDEEDRLFSNVGDFFQPKSGQTDGPALLAAFAKSKPEKVQAALERIVPAEIQTEIGLQTWDWLRTSEEDGMLDLLERARNEVVGDLETYQKLEEEAAAEKRYGVSGHYQQVTNTIRGRSLLGFLATRNLLPKYGFPTDVVQLKTDHLNFSEATKVELQRDLRIAIAEYAPGAEIVAAKRVWTGGGLYIPYNKHFPVHHYATCSNCGRFHQSAEELDGTCQICGTSLFAKRHLYGKFIVPEFGFVAADRKMRSSGEARPQRLYASRAYFSEYAPPNKDSQPSSENVYEDVLELSGPTTQLQKFYSRFGKLALVNSGAKGRGFNICTVCGYGEMAQETKPKPIGVKSGKSSKSGPHKHPRTGRDCINPLYPYHLGHEFTTDVLELRFNGQLGLFQEEKVWRSLLYTLLEGASQGLGIRRDDLDGTLYRYTNSAVPAILLFDNVPGGAGHVRRIGEELTTVFQSAFSRVTNPCCGPETSCYECLRNYRNQPYHNELQRGLAYQFLNQMFTGLNLTYSSERIS